MRRIALFCFSLIGILMAGNIGLGMPCVAAQSCEMQGNGDLQVPVGTKIRLNVPQK